jgi:hypothetical protein
MLGGHDHIKLVDRTVPSAPLPISNCLDCQLMLLGGGSTAQAAACAPATLG